MHGALVISGVGKLRQAEHLERLRLQLLEENRDSYPADLGGQSERLPKSERAAKGAGIAQTLLIRRKDR